jgi:predicted MFS family arabinose efflux permease
LIFEVFFYNVSEILDAVAFIFKILYLARMIVGLAFGAALVLASIY